MATKIGIAAKVKEAVAGFFSPEECAESPSRVAAGKKAAKTIARKAAAKKVVNQGSEGGGQEGGYDAGAQRRQSEGQVARALFAQLSSWYPANEAVSSPMIVQRTTVALTLLMALKGVSAQPFEAPASAPSSGPVCSNYVAVMRQVGFPRRAVELNLKQGSVVLEFTLTSEGQITNVTAVESSHPVFVQAATDIISKYQCRGLGRDVRVRVPFKFQLSG